jgi:hypothetical protein
MKEVKIGDKITKKSWNNKDMFISVEWVAPSKDGTWLNFAGTDGEGHKDIWTIRLLDIEILDHNGDKLEKISDEEISCSNCAKFNICTRQVSPTKPYCSEYSLAVAEPKVIRKGLTMNEKRLIDYAKLEEYRGTLNQYVDTIWNSLEPASEFIQSLLDKKAEEVSGEFIPFLDDYLNSQERNTIKVCREFKKIKQKYIKGESNGKDS